MKTAEQMRKEHRAFMKRKKAIYEKNRLLIEEWNAIPWWKFWARPSFEQRREIIIANWKRGELLKK